MIASRPIIVGAGAAGAAVVVIAASLLRSDDAPPETGKAGYEVCLKTDVPLFENAPAKCYESGELLALLDQPVLDLRGHTVSLTMSHPSDKSVASRRIRNCRDYREMSFDGWFAETTREMRREGYFVRACGALAALRDAQKPESSHFEEGSPTNEDLAGVRGILRIGENEQQIDRVVVAQQGDFQWRIAADSQFVEIQELANADFDNDGIEEILIFLAGGTAGGSALFYDIGLMQKDAADASVTYAPLSFGREKAGAAG